MRSSSSLNHPRIFVSGINYIVMVQLIFVNGTQGSLKDTVDKEHNKFTPSLTNAFNPKRLVTKLLASQMIEPENHRATGSENVPCQKGWQLFADFLH